MTLRARKEKRFPEASAHPIRGNEESREPLNADPMGWMLLLEPSAHQQLPLTPNSQALHPKSASSTPCNPAERTAGVA